MPYQFGYKSADQAKHKVFVGYYHRDDQYYRDQFEKAFSHIFTSKSVKPGDIATDLSDEYIKRLIQEEYLTDASVMVVLVGPKTYCRKHVDWKISAALNKKVGGYSGLVGILLPNFPLSADNKYSYDAIPRGLTDNVDQDTPRYMPGTESVQKNSG